MDADPLMTTDEAAEYLRIHRRTVNRMIVRGELRAVKVGRHWKIKRSEVERLADPKHAISTQNDTQVKQGE